MKIAIFPKSNKFLLCLSIFSLLCHGATEDNQNPVALDDNHLYRVLTTPALRQTFAPFLDNVLRQLPANQFFKAVDQIFGGAYPQQDQDFYAQLLKSRNKLIPQWSLYQQFKLVRFQKELLAKQAKQLLDVKPNQKKKINGLVEIGTPGTYISAMDFLDISGDVYVINDKERAVRDRVQSFTFNLSNGFLPYNRFVPLNDYAPIEQDDIPTNSVDLMVCFIGLHHIPIERLEDFVASIGRILRPGGQFILRDHDCQNEELTSLISAAHSIFNVVIPGESVQTERDEYRNFRTLHYWISLLERHGFDVGPERLLQDGDPTQNTMLAFTKRACTADEKLCEIALQLKDTQGYQRDLMQTYLTAPEWFNVDASQEYGKFIEHTPFYEFPYFRSVASYWKIFLGACKTAAKKQGMLHVLTSSYTLMNLFVGVSMSLEYAAKSLVSAPIRWLFSGEEPSTIQALIHDPFDQINAVDQRIKVINNYPDTHAKLIEVPRYKAFLHIMHRIADSDINLLEIAGQKSMCFKVRYEKNDGHNPLIIDECTKEYDWHVPTQPAYTYAALTVPIKSIKEVIKILQERGIEILYMHDY